MASPTYQENECKSSGPCKDVWPGVCQDCGQPIPKTGGRYTGLDGAGFKAHTSTHGHFRPAKGGVGIQPVFRELCWPCVEKDFQAKYPGQVMNGGKQ